MFRSYKYFPYFPFTEPKRSSATYANWFEWHLNVNAMVPEQFGIQTAFLLQFCTEVRKIHNMDTWNAGRFFSFTWSIVTPGTCKTDHKLRHEAIEKQQLNRLHASFLTQNIMWSTIVRCQGRQKIYSKTRKTSFWEINFFKKSIFYMVKKGILGDIPKIWHLPNWLFQL
jgi:hypothetical protein